MKLQPLPIGIIMPDENYTYENIKFYIDGQEVLVGCGHNWTNSQSYVFPDDNFLVGQSSTFYSNRINR